MPFMTRKLTLVLTAGLTAAAWQPPILAHTPAANLFDAHVALGLPQAFALPRETDDERGPGVDEVVIKERLDTDAAYPDGSHATTYAGTAGSHEAVFTRLGPTLSVSVLGQSVEAGATIARHRSAPAPGQDDVIVPSFAQPARIHAALTDHPPAELRFWIFLHDDAGESNYAKFHNWYVAWWIRDMEKTVKPGIPVKVIIKDHLPGVTDFDYRQGRRDESLFAFRSAADGYLYEQGVMPSALTKVMLFVGDRPDNWKGAYGIAIPRDTVAMASGTGPRHGVAHEFGHTLNAQHEYAETRFPCVTNMSAYVPGLFSCQIYSGQNDVQIREYVQQTVEREAH